LAVQVICSSVMSYIPVTLTGTQHWKGQPNHQWQRQFSASVNNH